MQLSQEKKDDVLRSVVDMMLKGLENSTLSEDDFPQIADFVLEKIDGLQSDEELVTFLSQLAERWSAFYNIHIHEKGRVVEQSESQLTQSVLDLAKEGKIDEAVDLAKTVTEPQV